MFLNITFIWCLICQQNVDEKYGMNNIFDKAMVLYYSCFLEL